MDVVLYVHVSKETDDEDGTGDIVQHKFRTIQGLSCEELDFLTLVEGSIWRDIAKKSDVTRFLNTGWTKLQTFWDIGGYVMPPDVRVVRVIHVISHNTDLDAFDME